jgi:hypothetical protein
VKKPVSAAAVVGNLVAVSLIALYGSFLAGVGFWIGLRFIEEFLP